LKNPSLSEKLFQRLAILNDSVRLKKRALAFFFMIIFVPMMIIISLYFRYSVNIIEQEVSALTIRSLGQVKNNLDYRFSNVAETALIVINSLYSYFSQDNPDNSLGRQMDEFSSINLLLTAYDGRYMINKLRLYVPDDKFYANQQDTFYPISLLEKKDLYKDMLNKGRQVFWEQTHLFHGKYYRENDPIFSCVAMLTSSKDFDYLISVLHVDILEQDISDILDIGLDYDESVFLIDSGGVIISHKNKELLGKKSAEASELQRIKAEQRGTFEMRLAGGKALIAFEKLSFQDWYLISEIPKGKIYGSVFSSFGFISSITMVLILTLLALALVLLFSMVLESAISRVDQATIRFEEKYAPGASRTNTPAVEKISTISSLEEHVDHLTKRIVFLTEESYKAQIANREAQLKALQSQINPHFLYNTLDTIKWMIMSGDSEMSVWMVNSLSRYFRLSLNKGKDIVPLQDEVDLVMTYLGIQQKRFKNVFTVTSHLEPEALTYSVPKLLLQPIVENALYHGVRGKSDNSGIIDIRVEMDEGDIIAEIYDNGEGMSEEKIRDIMNKNNESGGYGIKNVDERIKLFCGKEYGISVFSAQGRGTTVSMRLKALKLPKDEQ
jgi:two-component system sensor histidine kinase YesM